MNLTLKNVTDCQMERERGGLGEGKRKTDRRRGWKRERKGQRKKVSSKKSEEK